MKYLFLLILSVPMYLFAQEFVTIGSVNNIATSFGKGVVPYEYEISVAEVTNEEYCLFLNNVAATDQYKLYSKLMSQHPFGGIIREGQTGAYKYKVKPGYQKKPVVCVTWNSAIRYINWLHYNSQNIENSCTEYLPYTEGTSKTGAYNTEDFHSNKAIQTCKARNKDAIYWLPNEDEWLKAAYYDPSVKKWNEKLFMKGSNCYSQEKGWMLPYPHIKDVKINTQPSPFGTYDQQGNAAEWIENIRGTWRLAIGGSLIRPRNFAGIRECEADAPDKPIPSFGFRVCRKPKKKERNIEPDYILNSKYNESIKPLKCDKNGGLYVLCDEAGNIGDLKNQFRGYVGYDFYISKYELSNEQYCNFLNSVAVLDDPFKLYNENMSHGICGGIIRIKENNQYKYIVKNKYRVKPVTYINYCSLVRYVNWLHYGCPKTGKSELGTTEGTRSLGAYDTSDFEDVLTGKKKVYSNWGKRNEGALYWIPSDDEWYKAAYYDPTRIGTRKYYDYPTRTSDPPTSEQANYMVGDSILNSETFVVDVDNFANAKSYFGTQQQGGNVWEWTEDWQYGSIGNRGLRGGSWSYTAYGLNAINVDPGGLNDFSYVFGGRICKATNNEGFRFVEKTFAQKILETWVMLSPKKIFILIFLFVISVLSSFVLFILIIYKK